MHLIKHTLSLKLGLAQMVPEAKFECFWKSLYAAPLYWQAHPVLLLTHGLLFDPSFYTKSCHLVFSCEGRLSKHFCNLWGTRGTKARSPLSCPCAQQDGACSHPICNEHPALPSSLHRSLCHKQARGSLVSRGVKTKPSLLPSPLHCHQRVPSMSCPPLARTCNAFPSPSKPYYIFLCQASLLTCSMFQIFLYSGWQTFTKPTSYRLWDNWKIQLKKGKESSSMRQMETWALVHHLSCFSQRKLLFLLSSSPCHEASLG